MDDLPVYRLRRDRYRRARGGNTRLIDIYCAPCNELLLVYQKDMPRGKLKRCYIDRIFYPERFSSLHNDPKVRGKDDLPPMSCGKCGALVGVPMLYAKHGEHRLAYGMLDGRFVKRNSTHAAAK